MPARGVYSIFPGCIFPALRFLGVLSALFPWLPNAQGQAFQGQAFQGQAFQTQAMQSPSPQAAARLSTGNFRQTVARAGLIFEGTVTAIEAEVAPGGKSTPPRSYRVSLRVKQGIHGVRSGEKLTIREWAGLWTGSPASENRYRVGEHAVFFLYPPGRAGLTSTVGGRTGKLLVTGGKVALPPDWPELLPQAAVTGIGTPAARPTRVPVAWLVQRIQQTGVRAELASRGGN